MKKVLTLLFINIVFVLIQSSFFMEIFGAEYNPNFVIAFAFALFFMGLEELSIISAFLGGLFLDLFGFSIVGISPLVITGSLVLFTYVKKYLFKGWLSNIVLVFLAQIAYSQVLFGFPGIDSSDITRGVSTLLLSLFFYFINQNFISFFGHTGYKV